MTYEYKPGEVPVPARTCVRCAAALESLATPRLPGGKVAGWFQPSRLSGDTIWVFTSRAQPAGTLAEVLRCPTCDRHYALVR
jgi:hypothetical protein